MSDKLASLLVDMQLNSAALRSGIDAAKGAFAGLGESVKGIGTQLNSLASMKTFEIGKDLVKGLGEFVMKGAEAADKMGKLAQSAGVPVEAFSRLDYAAGLAGVSSEDLGTAFTKLNVSLAKAGAGSADQVALFHALGVSVKDASGNVRASSTVMSELATKFAGLKDGASKSALAVEIFGKSGAKLLPFLNEGGEGLKRLGEEADRFGVTVTEGAAASAERFNDDLEKLKRAAEGVGMRVAAELTPALSSLTEKLLNSKEGADALKGAVETLAAFLKVLVSGGIIVGAVFDAVGTQLARSASAVVNVVQGNFSDALTDITGFMTDLPKTISKAGEELSAVWSDAVPETKKLADASRRTADGIVSDHAREKKAGDEYKSSMESLTKVALDLEAKVAGFGGGPIEEMAAKLEHGELAEKLAKIGDAADDMKARILAAVTALADLELGRQQLKSDFAVNESATDTAREVGRRTSAFADAGREVSPGEGANRAREKGFQDFDSAIANWAEHTTQAVRDSERANLLRVQGDEEGALYAQKLAAEEQRMAQDASEAADAFQRESDNFVSTFSTIAGAIGKAGQSLVGKMGDIGSVINAGIQGGMSGGPWGAIIAVIGELVGRMSVFTKFADMLNDKLFATIEKLNEAAKPLFEALTSISTALNPIREVIHSIIGMILKFIQPIFVLIGKVLEGVGKAILPLMNVFDSLGSAFSSITDTIHSILPIWTMIGIIFKLVGAAINFAAIGIMITVTNVLSTIRDIVKAVGGNVDGLTKTINEIGMSTVKMIEKQRQFDLLKDPKDFTPPDAGKSVGPGLEGLDPQFENLGTTVEKVTDKFSEMLTNLPSGYKGVRAAIFGADGAGGLEIPETAKNGGWSGPGANGQITFPGDGGVPPGMDKSGHITFTGPVTLMANDLMELSKQVTQAQTIIKQARRRNPHEAP